MKTLLSMIVLMCLPLITLAITDPSPDVMGIYFDTDYLTEESSAMPNVPFMVYVVLLNPIQSEIQGYEFGYDHWVPTGSEGMVLRLATNFPDGIIILDPPFDPLVGSYSIWLPTGLPAQQAVVLLSWEYMILGDNFPVHFHLTAAEFPTIPGGLPGYWGPEGVSTTGYAETCFGTGARVNESCPLPVETMSFGTIKGLYR